MFIVRQQIILRVARGTWHPQRCESRTEVETRRQPKPTKKIPTGRSHLSYRLWLWLISTCIHSNNRYDYRTTVVFAMEPFKLLCRLGWFLLALLASKTMTMTMTTTMTTTMAFVAVRPSGRKVASSCTATFLSSNNNSNNSNNKNQEPNLDRMKEIMNEETSNVGMMKLAAEQMRNLRPQDIDKMIADMEQMNPLQKQALKAMGADPNTMMETMKMLRGTCSVLGNGQMMRISNAWLIHTHTHALVLTHTLTHTHVHSIPFHYTHTHSLSLSCSHMSIHPSIHSIHRSQITRK